MVIDLNLHYDEILKCGIEEFLRNHINNQLNLLKILEKNSCETFENLTKQKKIIISLNKKDMLDTVQMRNIDEHIKSIKIKNSTINTISCADEKFTDDGNNDSLNELLIQLQSVISDL